MCFSLIRVVRQTKQIEIAHMMTNKWRREIDSNLLHNDLDIKVNEKIYIFRQTIYFIQLKIIVVSILNTKYSRTVYSPPALLQSS